VRPDAALIKSYCCYYTSVVSVSSVNLLFFYVQNYQREEGRVHRETERNLRKLTHKGSYTICFILPTSGRFPGYVNDIYLCFSTVVGKLSLFITSCLI